jgi:hypothetical protein
LQLVLSVNCNGTDVDASGWTLMFGAFLVRARPSLSDTPGDDGASPA